MSRPAPLRWLARTRQEPKPDRSAAAARCLLRQAPQAYRREDLVLAAIPRAIFINAKAPSLCRQERR
jgi:hypothetical protein